EGAAVDADRLAVVGGEDDQRAVVEAGSLQLGDDPPDLDVDHRRLRVVAGYDGRPGVPAGLGGRAADDLAVLAVDQRSPPEVVAEARPRVDPPRVVAVLEVLGRQVAG